MWRGRVRLDHGMGQQEHGMEEETMCCYAYAARVCTSSTTKERFVLVRPVCSRSSRSNQHSFGTAPLPRRAASTPDTKPRAPQLPYRAVQLQRETTPLPRRAASTHDTTPRAPPKPNLAPKRQTKNLPYPAVQLQRPTTDHEYHQTRLQPRGSTFDVHELLGPEIRPETGLGDDDVGQLQAQVRRDDGVAAVRDVRYAVTKLKGLSDGVSP